jgi:hypothetical protein
LNLLLPDANGIPGGNPGQYQTLVEPFIHQQQTNQANAAVAGSAAAVATTTRGS